MINLHRDRYRREQRSPVRSRPVDDQGEDNIIEFAESSEPSPEDWARYSDLESATRNAMHALPPEVCAVVSLYMVDARSYREIADIVGCPIGTVMSRLARGRRLLRTSLTEHVDSHPEQKRLKASVYSGAQNSLLGVKEQ